MRDRKRVTSQLVDAHHSLTGAQFDIAPAHRRLIEHFVQPSPASGKRKRVLGKHEANESVGVKPGRRKENRIDGGDDTAAAVTKDGKSITAAVVVETDRQGITAGTFAENHGDDDTAAAVTKDGKSISAAVVVETDRQGITTGTVAENHGDDIAAATVTNEDRESVTATAVFKGQLPVDYINLIKRLIDDTDPAEAQLGRHLKELAEWSVVDSDMAAISVFCAGHEYVSLAALMQPPLISRETMKLLRQLPELRNEVTALAGYYPNLDRSIWPFSVKQESISTLTVISILLALKSDPAAGGDTSLEAETKLLGVRIFADIIAVVGGGLRTRLEYTHLFKAGSDGFTRSDLVITAPDGGGLEIPVFVLECQKDVRAVHKDHIVCTAQAVLEARKVIPYVGLADFHRARFHMALVSGSIIQFSVLAPEYRDGGIFWVTSRRGPTFNLCAQVNVGRLIDAMKMTKFILDIVVPDAQFLREKVLAQRLHLDVKALLPPRPVEPPKSRESTAPFTPKPKKQRVYHQGGNGVFLM
ncbi:hypothetical protein HDU85_004122 [Gaertneriomyces sp. JEL0708]|nr:hypothetical protein HDU85_004122 [Gaertneriomyces sp. JEL0708]